VAHLTEGAAGDGVDVGPVEGVQLHGSSGARSARMCMRVSGERLAEVGELNGATRSGARAKRQRPNRREAGAPPSRARAARGGPAAPRAAEGGSWRDGHSRCRARSARPTSEHSRVRSARPTSELAARGAHGPPRSRARSARPTRGNRDKERRCVAKKRPTREMNRWGFGIRGWSAIPMIKRMRVGAANPSTEPSRRDNKIFVSSLSSKRTTMLAVS
jgi:hypothetical protein